MTDFLKRESDKPRMDRCEVHGEFESRNVFGRVWSKCPLCVLAKAQQDEAERMREHGEKEAAAWLARIGRANIPERFKDRSLASFCARNDGQKYALTFAKDFADSFSSKATGRSAIFSGNVGTGKTHLAVGIALHVMRDYGKSAVFITVQRLIRTVRDTWRKDSDASEIEAIRTFSGPDLLILDEVGIQAGSENERQILFDVLNERYENRKSTLLLTNLSVSECKHYLGERVFDRMREDGGEFVAFDWDSYRGKM